MVRDRSQIVQCQPLVLRTVLKTVLGHIMFRREQSLKFIFSWTETVLFTLKHAQRLQGDAPWRSFAPETMQLKISDTMQIREDASL